MKISHGIREEFGPELDADAGMRAKSDEFAAGGHRVYLPVAD